MSAEPGTSDAAVGGLSQSEVLDVVSGLRRMGLVSADEVPELIPLTGGVSSMILRVRTKERSFCYKRALARLKVATEWHAPVSRNAAEAAWIAFAGEVVPHAVPTLIGHDEATGSFAMDYLEPGRYAVWKSQLLAGHAAPETARAVARTLVALHAASTRRSELAERFDHHENFHQLRLDPYFLTAAQHHPDVAAELRHITEVTHTTRLALVHGDVSPKNILVGGDSPVLLDAECATWGDPAFDLAFCLNHLLLKCLVRPDARRDYLASFDTLSEHYLAGVDWEPARRLEARAAALLPALLLARVDGKSPVEYLSSPAQREQVRQFAKRGLQQPFVSIRPLGQAWNLHLS